VVGFLFKRTKPTADLAATGIRGRATVEHMEMLHGGLELNVWRRNTPAVLRGDETPLRERVRLRVEVPGRAAYSVTTIVAVPIAKASWMLAGTVVEILVDPNHPDRVAIDWEGQHRRGSAEEAIMDSPYAMDAIQGLGLDPHLVAREADEARRKAVAEVPNDRVGEQ